MKWSKLQSRLARLKVSIMIMCMHPTYQERLWKKSLNPKYTHFLWEKVPKIIHAIFIFSWYRVFPCLRHSRKHRTDHGKWIHVHIESRHLYIKTLYFKGLVMAFKRKSEESQSTVFEVEFSKKIWNQKSAQNVFSVK